MLAQLSRQPQHWVGFTGSSSKKLRGLPLAPSEEESSGSSTRDSSTVTSSLIFGVSSSSEGSSSLSIGSDLTTIDEHGSDLKGQVSNSKVILLELVKLT